MDLNKIIRELLDEKKRLDHIVSVAGTTAVVAKGSRCSTGIEARAQIDGRES